MAGRGWAQTAPRVGGTRLAQGRGSVGAGWGSGGAGERASVDAMRRRGQREGGGKSPIGAHPDRNGRRGGWLGAVDAMQAAKRDAYKTAAMNAGEMAGGGHAAGTSEMTGGACGKQARPAPQGAKPVRPCRVSHAAVAWRKARSAGPHAATAERPGGAGNIFAPCVISGSSTRKRALGGKIRAPCILNRPIAPGNGCIGRRCCQLDLEKHAFRAEVARKGAFFAHSAKKGCIRCGSCQSGPWGRRNARREMGRDADVGARWARWGGGDERGICSGAT